MVVLTVSVVSFWWFRFVASGLILVHAACTQVQVLAGVPQGKTWAVEARAPIPEVRRWQLKFCRGVHGESQAQSAIDMVK